MGVDEEPSQNVLQPPSTGQVLFSCWLETVRSGQVEENEGKLSHQAWNQGIVLQLTLGSVLTQLCNSGKLDTCSEILPPCEMRMIALIAEGWVRISRT